MSLFAFESKAWKSVIRSSGPDMNCFFLRKVHRQGDPRFRELLNRMRVGQATAEDIKLLKTCRRRITYEDGIEAIRLYAHRDSVNKENEKFLETLPGELIEIASTDKISPYLSNEIRAGRRRWFDVDKLRAHADR